MRQTDRRTLRDSKDRAYASHRAVKPSDYYEILYTAADFELDERHVIKK